MSKKISKLKGSMKDIVEVPFLKKSILRRYFITSFVCAAICTAVFSIILINSFNEVYLLNITLEIFNVTSALVTIICGMAALLPGYKTKRQLVIRLIICTVLTIIIGIVMVMVINKNLSKTLTPSDTFPHSDRIIKTTEAINNETSQMFGITSQEVTISQYAETPFVIPDSLEDSQSYLFPSVISNNIHSILEKTNNIFDFIEQSGILNKNNDYFETYSIANQDILISTHSIIPEYEESYGTIVNRIEKKYTVLRDNYYNNSSNPLSIDAVIREYNDMIAHQETAKTWSIKHADGISLDLVVLLARNYKELADLLNKRGDLGDSNLAIENYTKSIIEYALFYRMCEREGIIKKIEDYQVLYWIADIYHSLGDIYIVQENYAFRLGSFGTADSFFAKNVEYRKNDRFQAYSRYYSAMSSHKLYNAINKRFSGKLPVELKYYLHDAYVNYGYAKDSNELKPEERVDAKRAMSQIAEACIKYLKQYPYEEKGDTMKSRSYYVNK